MSPQALHIHNKSLDQPLVTLESAARISGSSASVLQVLYVTIDPDNVFLREGVAYFSKTMQDILHLLQQHVTFYTVLRFLWQCGCTFMHIFNIFRYPTYVHIYIITFGLYHYRLTYSVPPCMYLPSLCLWLNVYRCLVRDHWGLWRHCQKSPQCA